MHALSPGYSRRHPFTVAFSTMRRGSYAHDLRMRASSVPLADSTSPLMAIRR